MIFEQFKDATKKDQSKKKEIFTNRIEFLKTLKDDVQKNPKNFASCIHIILQKAMRPIGRSPASWTKRASYK